MEYYRIADIRNDNIVYHGYHKSFSEALEFASSRIPLIHLDLRNTDLRTANLDGLEFRSCVFSGSCMTGANFSECSFRVCDFSNASMEAVCCCFSTFYGCDFRFTSFGATDIAGAEMERCVFSGLATFSLKFRETGKIHYCNFETPDGFPIQFNQAPVVIEGLNRHIAIIERKNLLINGEIFTDSCRENTNETNKDFRANFIHTEMRYGSLM